MEASPFIDFDIVLEWLKTSGLRTAGIIVGAFIVVQILSFITRRIEKLFDDDDPSAMSEREKQAATLGKVLRNIIRIAIGGIAGMMILREFGVAIGPLLAGVGVVGLAVGFGAQSLVKDFLSGMFILAEGQFHVGDVIKAAGVAGLVERITLRTTILRDLEGKVHIIPNGQIEVVSNLTKHWSRSVLDIGVAYKEDVDRVIELMQKVGDELTDDTEFGPMINAPLEVLGVNEFADSAVVIRVMFTTKPSKQWAVGREYRRRVKKAFDAARIEIPFPHRTVYLGEASPMDGRMAVELASKRTDSETG